jgi:ankyrin repeat protein
MDFFPDLFDEFYKLLPSANASGLSKASNAACRLRFMGRALKTNEHGETDLHIAVKDDDKKQVEYLLRKKFPMQATDEAGWTALHDAAARGQKDMVELLLNAGANIGKSSNFQNIFHILYLYVQGSFSLTIFCLL